MRYCFILLLCQLVFELSAYPITPKETNFRSPVKHKIAISGNFGELRSKHFHAGLDIKSSTGGSGDSIFAAEEGYVSRIKIQRGGYGRALYVDHPNGYTTVYAHLENFCDLIQQDVMQHQYANMSYEIDLTLPPGRYQLHKGQHVGYMGNSGHSFGAHLHFEIRETASDNPMNPLLFNIRPQDTKPPLINSVRVTGLTSDFQKLSTARQATKKNKSGDYKEISMTVPDAQVGISVAGYDQNDFGNSKNGIYRLELYVDEVLYYSYNLNAFSFKETHLIEAHTDYEVKQKQNSTEVLCYRLPGNTLSVIDQLYNQGIIDLTPQAKRIRIVARDFDGNASEQILYLSTHQNTGLFTADQNNNIIPQGSEHVLTHGDLQATIFANSLQKSTRIDINSYLDHKGRPQYQIGSSQHPILDPIKLEVAIPSDLLPYAHKLGFMLLGSEPDCFGQEILGDKMITYADDFGTYGFVVDTIAPTIKTIHFSTKTQNKKRFTFKIDDNITTRHNAKPIEYHVYIDQQWLPCEMKSTNNFIYVDLENLYQGDHQIRLEAIDQFNNRAEWQGNFAIE